MKKEDVKFGMKVVPFQKTSLYPTDIKDYVKNFDTSASKFLRDNGFLYVKYYDNNVNAFVLGNDPTNRVGGDYFNVEDFEPYYEILLKKQEIQKCDVGRKIIFLDKIKE